MYVVSKDILFGLLQTLFVPSMKVSSPDSKVVVSDHTGSRSRGIFWTRESLVGLSVPT